MNLLSSDLVRGYASLFVHQWSSYALQEGDGSYRRIVHPLSFDLLVKHLLGHLTLGTYLLDERSSCAFAVFDADHPGGLEQLAWLSLELAGQGIPALLEASRRGGHLWVLLSEPTPAWAVRAWLLPYALPLGLELYPKQDRLPPGGAGSLIRLPLGVHRKTRGWYPFVQLTTEGVPVPVGNTVVECCAWTCATARRVSLPDEVISQAVSLARSPSTVEPCIDLQQGQSGWQSQPESIRAWCRSQDIVAVIGQYVVLDRRGVGSCPFKEHHYRGDLRPSLQVFGGK
jgi:hypothetical protein